MVDSFRKGYEKTAILNHKKVLDAFKKVEVSTDAFNGSTGYGYDDYGRMKLNQLYSEVFRGEDALVSSKFASGTHAIYTTLLALVKPNDRIVSLTGALYDTMDKALKDRDGLINKYGVTFNSWDLVEGDIDTKRIINGELSDASLVIIQRSRGYSTRNSISVKRIEEVISLVRKHAPNVTVFVDNCYGEFVEEREPLEVGADIIAGSLIKNPGGTIALSGGYVVGKRELISKVSSQFSVPGIGREIGCENSENLRLMFQGLFLAPKIVEESLLSAYYLAETMGKLGFRVDPKVDDYRTDIIQSIYFDKEEDLIDFVQTVQFFSPVDSKVKPIPWDMPGYDHKVIMASGSFISGSSLEMSCDAPIRKPYVAYYQGGVSFYYSKLAIDSYKDKIMEKRRKK